MSKNPDKKGIALIIATNYTGTSAELQGCGEDMRHWKQYLGLRCSRITTLWDRQASKGNIERALWNITRDSHMLAPSEVWIIYSGHGTQVTDRNGDEPEGLDEALVPHDYQRAGMLTDDEVSLILSRMSTVPKTYVIVDACHSGSIVEGIRNPNLTLISGCKDEETSADTPTGGALSTLLLSELKGNPKADPVSAARKLSYISPFVYHQSIQVTSFKG